jgi:predicted dehydrogenase
MGEEIIKVKDLTGAEEVFVNYGYLGETQHFIDCIMNDKQPETNLEHAVKIMELIETILN